MGFFNSFKRAYDGTPQTFERAGRQVTCSHCGGTDFEEGSAQLNTAGLTLLDLDWLNKSATIYRCCACGHIEWFVD